MDLTSCLVMVHSQLVMQLIPLSHEGGTKSIWKTDSSMQRGASC